MIQHIFHRKNCFNMLKNIYKKIIKKLHRSSNNPYEIIYDLKLVLFT